MKENIIKSKSFQLAVDIVLLSKKLIAEQKEFVLGRQILRSGTSVGANVREAINAESKKDFIHKLSIAQKECDETRYWLEILFETNYIDKPNFDNYHNQATEVLKILRSIIISSKRADS